MADPKTMYGLVETPMHLADEMVGLVRFEALSGRVWLDCGAGLGAIGAAILRRDPTAARVGVPGHRRRAAS